MKNIKAFNMGVVIIMAIFIFSFLYFFTDTKDRLTQSTDTDIEDGLMRDIEWTDTAIYDESGNLLISSGDIPSSVQVSADAEFGVGGPISGALLSPDKDFISITTRGAAHDAGWLYDVKNESIHPVAFQYGGGVEGVQWSPDSKYIVFKITTPAPTDLILAVDRNELAEFVGDSGFRVELPEEESFSPPYSYEFVEWQDNNTLCFLFEGEDACVNLETGNITKI